MFGQNTNDQSQPTDQNNENPVLQNSAPPAGFNPGGFAQPQPQAQATPSTDPMNLNIPSDATAPDTPANSLADPVGAPAVPSAEDSTTQVPSPAPEAPAPSNDSFTPPAPTPPEAGQTPANDAPIIMDTNASDFGIGSTPEDSSDTAQIPSTPSEPANTDDLLSMKQTALQELQPLVGHLDQSPEEKFRTLMMMIQASDDHTKLNEAFDLAKQITDEKIRAQALLDVINEINYFTQQSQNN